MKKYIIPSIFVAFFIFPNLIWAVTCDDTNIQSKSKVDQRAILDACNAEIVQWQKVLDDTTIKKNTLQGDVTTLNAQIAKATSEIKQRNITLTDLTAEINQKINNISSLEARLENDKSLLANLIKKKSQNDFTLIIF